VTYKVNITKINFRSHEFRWKKNTYYHM